MQHHITIPEPIARFILARWRWILSLIGLITTLAVVQICRTPFSISAIESFTADSETFEDYQSRAKLFGGDTDSLIFAATDEGEELFSAAKLNSVRRAALELEELPAVQRVVALTEVVMLPQAAETSWLNAVRSTARAQLADGVVPEIASRADMTAWWPLTEDSQSRVNLPKSRQVLLEDGQIVGRLLSADGCAQCMIIQLHPDQLGLQTKSQIRHQIVDVLRTNGLGSTQLHVSGMIISESWILTELRASLWIHLPIGILIIGCIVFGMYRSLAIAGLTILVGLVAAVWAVAFTGLVFGKITILVAAVPLLIMVMSTSDTIHIVSAYSRELAKDLSRSVALQAVIRDVGGACLLTSLTTLVGFLSLLLVPVTATRHLAVTAGVGVALALLLAITIIPIGISLLRFNPPDVTAPGRASVNALVMRLVQLCRWISLTYPRGVVTVHLIIMVIAASYALRIKFDPNIAERFGPHHPLAVSIRYFNEHFVGTNTVEIFVKGDADNLLSPRTLAYFASIHDRLTRIPEVKSVSSVNDLFALVDRAIDYQTDNGLPDSEASATASLRLVKLLQPEAVRALIAPEEQLARITAHTSLTSFFDVLELSKHIEQVVHDELPEALTADVSGVMPVIAKSVERIVDSQFTGLVFCFTVVSAIVMLALRSVRLGLLSLLPNICPLLLLAGCLGARMTYVDSDYIIVFTIAFGIAVDDTIHFLHRYDVEVDQGQGHRRALQAAYAYSGRAIMQTTVVLGLGLLPLALSQYLTIWMLGTYLVLTLLFAVLADLLFLPALLLWLGKEPGES